MIVTRLSHHLVELKVDDLAARYADRDLPVVGGRAANLLPARRLPLVDAAVGEQVADAHWIDLHNRVFADEPHEDRRRVGLEARVSHLLDRLAHRKDQSGVDERDDNVSVVLGVTMRLDGP